LRRASANPIAIACFRLFTFRPDRPLLSVPRFILCIAPFTFFFALLPYRAMGDSFRRASRPRVVPTRACNSWTTKRRGPDRMTRAA
jgi:hypothetical protein